VIKSFRDVETRRVYCRRFSSRLPIDIQAVALRKLRMLHNATGLGDLLSPPANRLEKLKGSRSGQYSIRINDQWRICFIWADGDAYDVEICDYH
jgi:proteic killer suppression protein